jgi:hypothetical protein
MKPEAEKIQLRISQRLRKMEKAGIDARDIGFLWDWSHKLFEHANKLELNERTGVNKLRQIKEILEM